MNEERMKILQMLTEGKITAEEAEKLLSQLDTEQDRKGSNGTPLSGAIPKYLYVNVEPKEGAKSEHGRVRIRVPVALIRAGMNIASLMPNDVRDKVDSAIHEKGIDFDISNLNPENIDSLLLALREFVVDVDTDTETVKINCE
jgi:hypothetical protein